MSKQVYIPKGFKGDAAVLIQEMDAIVDDYQEQGFRLTLRQIYYQLIARDLFPDERRWRWTGTSWVRDPNGTKNAEPNYQWLGSIVNDAKLAGHLDWDAFEDRTRSFTRRTRWASGEAIVKAAADSFHMDMWVDQPFRVFVIVEKEALVGVLEGVCAEYDIPLLAARGYPSGTTLREFALSDLLPAMGYDRLGERLKGTPEKGLKQKFTILHFGDHDPSGIDMTRDLSERLALFCNAGKSLGSLFQRVALNMQQVNEFDPPESPAKITDSRAKAYIQEFGHDSWELDALKPAYLADLVHKNVARYIDVGKWTARQAEVEEIRARLKKSAKNFK